MTKFTKANWMTRALQEKLNVVGEQFRLARLRRDLTMDQVAQRAQCTRLTLSRLEKGEPTVSLGVVMRVLSPPLKTIFQHTACIDKLYADSFYKVQKSSHSSFEVICCGS